MASPSESDVYEFLTNVSIPSYDTSSFVDSNSEDESKCTNEESHQLDRDQSSSSDEEEDNSYYDKGKFAAKTIPLPLNSSDTGSESRKSPSPPVSRKSQAGFQKSKTYYSNTGSSHSRMQKPPPRRSKQTESRVAQNSSLSPSISSRQQAPEVNDQNFTPYTSSRSDSQTVVPNRTSHKMSKRVSRTEIEWSSSSSRTHTRQSSDQQLAAYLLDSASSSSEAPGLSTPTLVSIIADFRAVFNETFSFLWKMTYFLAFPEKYMDTRLSDKAVFPTFPSLQVQVLPILSPLFLYPAPIAYENEEKKRNWGWNGMRGMDRFECFSGLWSERYPIKPNSSRMSMFTSNPRYWVDKANRYNKYDKKVYTVLVPKHAWSVLLQPLRQAEGRCLRGNREPHRLIIFDSNAATNGTLTEMQRKFIQYAEGTKCTEIKEIWVIRKPCDVLDSIYHTLDWMKKVVLTWQEWNDPTWPKQTLLRHGFVVHQIKGGPPFPATQHQRSACQVVIPLYTPPSEVLVVHDYADSDDEPLFPWNNYHLDSDDELLVTPKTSRSPRMVQPRHRTLPNQSPGSSKRSSVAIITDDSSDYNIYDDYDDHDDDEEERSFIRKKSMKSAHRNLSVPKACVPLLAVVEKSLKARTDRPHISNPNTSKLPFPVSRPGVHKRPKQPVEAQTDMGRTTKSALLMSRFSKDSAFQPPPKKKPCNSSTSQHRPAMSQSIKTTKSCALAVPAILGEYSSSSSKAQSFRPAIRSSQAVTTGNMINNPGPSKHAMSSSITRDGKKPEQGRKRSLIPSKVSSRNERGKPSSEVHGISEGSHPKNAKRLAKGKERASISLSVHPSCQAEVDPMSADAHSGDEGILSFQQLRGELGSREVTARSEDPITREVIENIDSWITSRLVIPDSEDEGDFSDWEPLDVPSPTQIRASPAYPGPDFQMPLQVRPKSAAAMSKKQHRGSDGRFVKRPKNE